MTDSFEAILTQAENPAYVRVATARILLRQDLLNDFDELDRQLTEAIDEDNRLNRTPVAPRLVDEINRLQAEIEAAKVEFVFRSVGKRAWADLLAKHPPTKEQAQRIRGLDHNPATFPVAACGLSYIDPDDPHWKPDLTTEKFRERVAKFTRLEAAINNSQWDMLWAKCIDANIGGISDPKSLAAGVLHRVSGQYANSASAADEPSLAVSSSVA